MTIELLTKFLAWCSVVNIGLLLLWFLAILLFYDRVYAIHSRFFKISREAFNMIHYGGLGLYKIGLWLFSLTPYLVLQAMT